MSSAQINQIRAWIYSHPEYIIALIRLLATLQAIVESVIKCVFVFPGGRPETDSIKPMKSPGKTSDGVGRMATVRSDIRAWPP